MGVIVQRMIDARMGGVLFTRSPTDADALAIEWVVAIRASSWPGPSSPSA